MAAMPKLLRPIGARKRPGEACRAEEQDAGLGQDGHRSGKDQHERAVAATEPVDPFEGLGTRKSKRQRTSKASQHEGQDGPKSHAEPGGGRAQSETKHSSRHGTDDTRGDGQEEIDRQEAHDHQPDGGRRHCRADFALNPAFQRRAEQGEGDEGNRQNQGNQEDRFKQTTHGLTCPGGILRLYRHGAARAPTFHC